MSSWLALGSAIAQALADKGIAPECVITRAGSLHVPQWPDADRETFVDLGAEEGQPLRWRHRSSAARGEPSGSQRSRETTARIRHGCRAHAARRKRQMGEEVGSLSG